MPWQWSSEKIKSFLNTNHVAFQLTNPGIHYRNAAEKAIRTFKYHFISGLCSTDMEPPIRLWDRLLPQSLISLTLLCAYSVNPQLSYHSKLHGAFDYNRTSMAPLGILIVIHQKPYTRNIWIPHMLTVNTLSPLWSNIVSSWPEYGRRPLTSP